MSTHWLFWVSQIPLVLLIIALVFNIVREARASETETRETAGLHKDIKELTELIQKQSSHAK
jgi:CHASE3 domain sensor protein